MVPTTFYLLLAAFIFVVGAFGVLVRRNALIIFMCIELMLNSVNLTLVALSNLWGNLNGQVFVFIVMAVAAVEVAVGLAIVMAIVRHKDTTNVDEINLLIKYRGCITIKSRFIIYLIATNVSTSFPLTVAVFQDMIISFVYLSAAHLFLLLMQPLMVMEL